MFFPKLNVFLWKIVNEELIELFKSVLKYSSINICFVNYTSRFYHM